MIYGFQGKYRFLSNFWIEPDGSHVEGEYQAAKCANTEDVEKFKGLTPGQAKRLGRNIKVVDYWDSAKVTIMRNLVVEKFKNPKMAEMLLATGDEEIVEGNTWGDKFWGQVNHVGQNHLGKILMEVRKQLKEHSNES